MNLNEMIEYKKIKVSENDNYIDSLLKLSKAWADENSCPAYYENDVQGRVDVIGVIATSYEYKRLLNFYVEELNMNFNHALLVKRVNR